MTEVELLPCPFCGCKAWLHSYGKPFIREPGSSMGHRIECEGKCHAMTCYWHTKEQAIIAWNTRDQSKVLIDIETAEECKKELKRAIDSIEDNLDKLTFQSSIDSMEQIRKRKQLILENISTAIQSTRDKVDP